MRGHTPRQPRTAATRAVRRMLGADERARASGVPVDQLLEADAQAARERAGRDRDAPATTRRELLVAGASLAAGAGLATRPARGLASALKKSGGAPRVAIVGAGLAGLRCAHALWTSNPGAPVASTVYEANPQRAGGRCWTLRDFFDGGLISEHGGSFIDTTHTSVRALAAQLGLEEELVNGGDLLTGEEVYFIDGAYYTRAQAIADWQAVGFDAFHKARVKLRNSSGAEKKLDAMSVPQWLDSTEIGSGSRLGKLMIANTVTENGGDPEDQSALDLIEITDPSPRRTLELLPGDDERYHVLGGNDQLVSRMIAAMPPETVHNEHELVALRANSDRTITLSFQVGASTVDVTADLVVLALPFSTLRAVDLSQSGLSPTKQNVIATLGMGSNAKIRLELSHKTWPALGFSGASYSDYTSYCCAWDDSVPIGPDGSPALLLGFPGGEVGASGLTGEAHAQAPVADVQWLLAQIEPVFAGTTAAYTGRAYEDHWALDPWVQGAYSYYRVGQAASFGKIARTAQRPYYFAGEHTSIKFQGFLEGAVESGERAAREVLARV